jgi:phospholipid/cholesterol/gamma-HCH transport system permease protein
MATVAGERGGLLRAAARSVHDAIAGLGDVTLFTGRTLGWLLRRRPAPGTLLGCFYHVGVRSVPVMAITGTFIGMVLAVQAHAQFQPIGMGTRLGTLINMSVVCELGPVFAAIMLAGRVGGSMAAELATMRITEQIDALACLGANPLHYLVVPRLLACVLLIPLLTVFADVLGVLGGAAICTGVYHIDAHHYWQHARGVVTLYDVTVSLIKPMVFGAVIALLSCYRGFHGRPGAEGVGRAATEAFVIAFVTILALDFFLGMFFMTLGQRLGFTGGSKLL